MNASSGLIAPALAWTLAGATRAGTRSRRLRRPCQDRLATRRLAAGVLLGALADGAGSAFHGRQGAEAAVTTCLASLACELGHGHARSDTHLDQAGHRALAASADAVGDPERACTLIAFAITPERMWAGQVGDGALVVRARGATAYERALPRLATEHVNETILLGTPDWPAGARSRVLPPPDFVCALTDGLEHLAIHHADQRPHPGFFSPLDFFAAAVDGDAACQAALRRFLDEPRVAARTDDDLGLLLASVRGGAEAGDER